MADWQVDLAAFSETSHTLRAVSAIRSEFKAIGHRLAFGRSVDDKFPVKSTAGSFRGKSSGVAVSSALPVFSFEDDRVSNCIWAIVVVWYTRLCSLGTCQFMFWLHICTPVHTLVLKNMRLILHPGCRCFGVGMFAWSGAFGW